MSAPAKRAPHAWRDPDGAPLDARGRTCPVYVIVPWAWLEEPVDPADAPERAESGRRAYGRHRTCVRCGVSVVYAELRGEGGWYEVPLYGVDLDNLTPMRSPRCAPHLLSRDAPRAAREAATP